MVPSVVLAEAFFYLFASILGHIFDCYGHYDQSR